MGRLGEAEAADIALKDLRRHFPKATPRLIAQRCINWAADLMAYGGYTFVLNGVLDNLLTHVGGGKG